MSDQQNGTALTPGKLAKQLDNVAAGLSVERRRGFVGKNDFRLSHQGTCDCHTLPLASRALAHGLLFAFARALGEFGATTLVAGHIPGHTETLALAIYGRIEQFDDGGAWQLAVASLVLCLMATGAAEWAQRRRAP